MKTEHSSGFAKINLYLDIVGTQNGYHMLDTVVCTIDVKDDLTATSRKDDKITLRYGGGLYALSPQITNKDNAIKAAELFKKTFNTKGVDLVLHKKIPIGGGLGGSSADIAATLAALKRLYGIEEDMKPLADELGSDCGYLLSGGYARLTGRGERVEPLELDKKLYLVIVTAEGGVSSGECFKKFDELGAKKPPFSAEDIIESLKKDKVEGKLFYNALYEPACLINEQVKAVKEDIAALSPDAVAMSGSGSSVYGIFSTIELCEWARAKLSKKYKTVFTAETVSQSDFTKKGFLSRSIYKI